MSSHSSSLHLYASQIPGLISHSPTMYKIAADVQRASNTRLPVLITGETGTGKELIAQGVHALSPRANYPFIPLNCTALPSSLAEAALFGHKKGAFTDARTSEVGIIPAANGGTLFLDEIGDLEITLQPKLLRFLQEGEVHVLGDSKPSQVDVRVIAATNSDLHNLVAQKLFRQDLYYRLNVIEIHLPPLRKRREDIPLLVTHFLTLYSELNAKSGLSVRTETMSALCQYDWPGNVRELSNELQRVVAFATPGTPLTLADLSEKIQNQCQTESAAPQTMSEITFSFPPVLSLVEIKQQFEKAWMQEALQRYKGNLKKAAAHLCMDRHTLARKIDEYGLKRKRRTLAPQRTR